MPFDDAAARRPAASVHALSSLARANHGHNVLAAALNGFPELLDDDLALAVAIACIIDNVEAARPGTTVRTRLRTLLDTPRATPEPAPFRRLGDAN